MMKEYIKYIKTNLTERELLEQLAEEAAELGQAALKAIRAKELSNNPTPVDIDTAAANLLEEMKDVYLVFYLLYGWTPTKELDIESNPKLKRWAGRIKEAKAARAKEGGEENGISKDLFDDSEIETAARKISNYCDSHDCASCKFCLNVIGCLLMEYGIYEWENVLDDMKE